MRGRCLRSRFLLCRIGTQPKGIGDMDFSAIPPDFSVLPCRIGTQPKGIGDLWVDVQEELVGLACRIGTQPKGIGDPGQPDQIPHLGVEAAE